MVIMGSWRYRRIVMIERHGRSRKVGGGLGTPGGRRRGSGPGSRGGGSDAVCGGFGLLQLDLLARRRHGGGCRFFPGTTFTRFCLFLGLRVLAVCTGVGSVLGLHSSLVLLAARPSRATRSAAGDRFLVVDVVSIIRSHRRQRVGLLCLPDSWRRIVGHINDRD